MIPPWNRTNRFDPSEGRLLSGWPLPRFCGVIAYAVYRWTPTKTPLPGKVRLVVLAFKISAAIPSRTISAAGLTDEMITRLGSLDPRRLGVIAAASSNAQTGETSKEIGQALSVQYALEGSRRRQGQSGLRIDVHLIQVSDQIRSLGRIPMSRPD